MRGYITPRPTSKALQQQSEEKPMLDVIPSSSRAVSMAFKTYLLRWRWLIVLVIAVFSFSFELLEHRPSSIRSFDIHLMWEIVLFCIALPLLIGIWLSLFESGTRLSTILSQVNIQRMIRERFKDYHDWDDLVTIVLQTPRTFLPLVGSSLLVRNPVTAAYDLAGEWSANNKKVREEAETHLQVCQLPLILGQQKVAQLNLYFYKNTTLQANFLKILQEMAPDMALAIEGCQLRRSILNHERTIEAERQQIARYLHDTLAQNLAFLRLKLDQLSISEPVESTPLHLEFERLKEVANQAYEQVRHSLVELQEIGFPDITTGIKSFAARVAATTSLEIVFEECGAPAVLPDHVMHEILYSVREMMRNVGKHAQAKKVKIRLQWTEDVFTVDIIDDGRGFDLNTLLSATSGYGLRMIKESMDELNGQLSVKSFIGQGTQVNLSIPLKHNWHRTLHESSYR
jgi:signal transduction histidine kinase